MRFSPMVIVRLQGMKRTSGLVTATSVACAERRPSLLQTTRLICPTGNFPNSLSSPVRKNISLRGSVETVLLIHRPALTRGALRGRHGRWERDAVDAAASAHASAQTNGADADGEVVWS